MNYSRIKDLFLRGFIGFLVLTALVAIIAVFSESFGKTQERILATTFTISIASICAMACAAFIERRKRVVPGLAGIASSMLAALLLLGGIWSFLTGDISFKITATFVAISVASAHAFLLALPELGQRRWVQQATALTIGLLAAQIILAVWIEIESQTYFRALAVVAIVVGLETLVIPILLKLKDKEKEPSEELLLTHVEGDLYKNASGDMYKVKALNAAEK